MSQSHTLPIASYDHLELPIANVNEQPVAGTFEAVCDNLQQITNRHPMRTRSKDGIFKPHVFNAKALLSIEPTSVEGALCSPQWKEAMLQEYGALMKNNTWTLIPMSENKKLIGSKWCSRSKEMLMAL